MRRFAILFAGFVLLAACDEAPKQEAKSDGKAQLSLELVDVSYEFRDGRHTYDHNRLFTETGGVGVNITRGKVCVMNGADCVDALVKYRVDASKTLLQKGHHVASPRAQDTITLH